jgi:D-3-phosphoglycerate dehydrogenase
MNMSYKVLVTDEIDEIAIKILQDVCEVHYRPVLNATDIKTIMRDYDALMIRSASRVTQGLISVAAPIKKDVSEPIRRFTKPKKRVNSGN